MSTLYFIYGPPAAGKLTVATQLSCETGISLFHNHLTFDLSQAIYPRFSNKFYDYMDSLRYDAFERAFDSNVSLIFTYCFDIINDMPFVNTVCDIAKSYNCNIVFVRLVVDEDTIMSRVTEDSRKAYGKVTSPEELASFIKKKDVFSPIPGVTSIEIKDLTPEQAVKKILTLK